MKPDMATIAAQSREIRAALDKGDTDAAEALMKKYRLVEQAVDPAALALAIVQARADGDEQSAAKLEAMIPTAPLPAG
jgi:hypothetical protein